MCASPLSATTAPPDHAARHLRLEPLQDLRVGLPGAEEHQSRDRQRRDLRAAGPQRRRQDHADQHHLRHRQPERRPRHRRRPRHHPRLPRRALADRPRAPGADHGRLRVRVEHGKLQPGPVGQGARSRLSRKDPQGPVAVGQEGQQDHHAFRRHEAPRDDRQGAGARAAHPVPRRAHRRRRRGAAQGHVGRGAEFARTPASPSSSPPTTSRRPR